METLKTYIIYILLIAVALLFAITQIKGCIGPKPKPPVVIDQVTTIPASSKDNEGLPAGEKAKTVTDLGTHASSQPGKITDTKLITTESGKTFKKDTEKSKFGFFYTTKFYVGFDGHITPGIAQEFFVWDRYSANALLGYPSVGIGLEGLLTQNFGIIGGCTWGYLDYDKVSDFNTYRQGSFSAKPILALAFNF